VGRKFVFAHPLGQGQRFLQADRGGYDLSDQFVYRLHSYGPEHFAQFLFIADADVACGKIVEHILARV